MILKINAELRTISNKKSVAKEIRKSGYIPAVIYGGGEEAKHVTLEKLSFMKSYKKSIGDTALFYITVDGKEIHTIIKSRQMHPVTREIIHVDFLELHPGKAISIEVPISFEGEATGEAVGGKLDVLMRKITAHCLPKDIPEAITVDVTPLNIGDSIHVADIKIDNVRFELADDVALVVVHAPKNAETEDSSEEEETEATE